MTQFDDTRRRALLGAASALALAGVASPAARAQAKIEFPSRPVRLIVPFPPGGGVDILARLLAKQLQPVWPEPVVIEYKPGAGTIIGTDFVAKAPPDGHTLGMAITALMINPALRPGLPYDTLRDLSGVSQISVGQFALFAHPSFEANTVAELIALARRQPGKLAYASSGTGTGPHLVAAMLESKAGIQLLHVPYKGSAAAQQDVVGGQVPVLFDAMHTAMPLARDGRLKVIAVAGPERVPTAPQVPTIAETVPGFSALSITGVIAPSGTPRELIERIGADIARAVRSPELADRFAQLGLQPVGSTPAQYDAVIRSDMEKWGQVIRSAGIKLD